MLKKIAEIIRVNQAGEYGAKRIYEGQIAALSKSDDTNSTNMIKHMYEQELEHLEYFNQELVKKRVRPTIMSPLWGISGYMLGYLSGKLGSKAAMACTAAVEEVIEHHYDEQLNYLETYTQEQHLRKKIEKFKNDEVDHKMIGLAGSSEEPHYQLLKTVVRSLTRIAIGISKKI